MISACTWDCLLLIPSRLTTSSFRRCVQLTLWEGNRAGGTTCILSYLQDLKSVLLVSPSETEFDKLQLDLDFSRVHNIRLSFMHAILTTLPTATALDLALMACEWLIHLMPSIPITPSSLSGSQECVLDTLMRQSLPQFGCSYPASTS
jgi:hypothetical protein